MMYWMAAISLAIALVAGGLGFFVLRAPAKGLAKAFFYIALMAAGVFLFFGYFYFGQPVPPG